MHIKISFILLVGVLLVGCVSQPPRDVNNICNVFRQYPGWYKDALDVQKRWLVPVPVQMAIIHQESKFDARAKPGRQKLLWVIPWRRPSTAYGYTQALDGTWLYTEIPPAVYLLHVMILRLASILLVGMLIKPTLGPVFLEMIPMRYTLLTMKALVVIKTRRI